MPFEWETISETAFSTSYRVKVLGGWIVMTLVQDHRKNSICQASVFVEDPIHEWDLDNPISAVHMCGDIYPVSKL